MTTKDIIAKRLFNQQIAGTKFTKPQQLVAYMGAMQAQEYMVSKWAIGLRLPGSNDAMIEKAINDGLIIRTHLMRPTWHFVAPADIRWMQQLTAPRVHAFNAFMYRKMELDEKLLKRCSNIIAKQLEGGKYLTRNILKAVLEKNKITTDTVRLSCIMMYAELETIICSGPKEGKQFTYALLEERVPSAKALTNEEALAELTTRYFTSRGPATVQDYVWWSGLTVKQAKEGIAMLSKKFIKETVEGKEYIFIPVATKPVSELNANFLMPDYDEYGIGYKDRTAIFSPIKLDAKFKANNPIFDRMIILDGIIAGTWQRTEAKGKISVQAIPFAPLTKVRQQALSKAIAKFTAFFENK